MKKGKSYAVYALITIIIWATAFLFTQYARECFSSESIGLLRDILASFILLSVLVVKRSGLPKLKDVPKFLLSGGIGFALYVVSYNMSVEMINGATCAVIVQIVPILTAIFSCVFFHEKISLRGWIAIAVAFSGILIMALWNGVLSVNPGILWMLLAALSMSVYNLTQRMYVRDYEPLQVTAYSILGGTLFLLFFLPKTVSEMPGASLKAWGAVIYLGVFVSALGYLFWTKAFSLAERTSDVSNFMFIMPVLTSLFGFFFKGEVPGIETVVGGVLILGGMFLFQTGRK